MRFNFNKILNEKHALKAFSRGIKENNLLVDLNDRISLALNLPKSQVYPQVVVEKKSVSKTNSALTWRLTSRSISNSNKVSYLQKPLVEINSTNSFFYRRSFIRKKKSFLLYRQGLKGGLRPLSVRSRFLRFSRSFLSNSSVSNKMYYLNLHKDTSLIFQKPKLSCVTSRLYTIFDRKSRSVKKHFNVQFLAVSNSDLYSSILKKLRKSKVGENRKKNFAKILTQIENKRNLFSNKLKKFDSKKNDLTLEVLKRLNQRTIKSDSKIKLNKALEAEVSSTNQLLENYLKLNETNKEKIKKTVEAANIEFIKSDLFKIRAEQLSKYTTGRKFTRSKRLKKSYKGKGKDFIKSNSKSVIEIYKRVQGRIPAKFTRNSADKSRFNKKSNIKPKLPIKTKKSKF